MTIDFFKRKYGYEIEGVWMPRVTAITSLLSKPTFFASYKYADWGTFVHKSVEKMLKGETLGDTLQISPSLEAFGVWKKAYGVDIANPAEDIEKRVYDFENGYAGTIDMVAQVQGRRGVIDLKTGNNIRDEYFLQTAAYLNAYNKTMEGKKECETRWILRIDQYQECRGCLARKKAKDGKERVSGGKDFCNHQWAPVKGESEFQELDRHHEDLEAFLAAKEVWEWYHRDILKQIFNYPKNVLQKILL